MRLHVGVESVLMMILDSVVG